MPAATGGQGFPPAAVAQRADATGSVPAASAPSSLSSLLLLGGLVAMTGAGSGYLRVRRHVAERRAA
ncbi:hypothetical protein HJ588_06775 [Flexivirga sp. ID2601S]|uniref:Uncharacterized protein n=1 Tax=Flexivirga aerilata TaxID=1656889 RepID=A0A849ADM6_9MICO|nr:hypothetical protein [Flexivirga aerilata]NNG38974.1 hypothetical protein [Flexivirga aerilata]